MVQAMTQPSPSQPAPEPVPRIQWEAFYANYRKPGYVPGFEIVHKLGGGMFGLVFKARKESIGKDYAIKFLKVDDESVRDAVLRELESVRWFAQIDHPNLVSIEDKGEVDGIPFLVMSYAGQETLQKRIQQGSMSRDEAVRIFAQAARGVQALHERSLVHFDLKPANIFLKGDVARVGDFGLSKLVTESRNSLSFGRGTPYYMAPEMLQRKGDARSDLYSLGVILYECLCGEVPFRGDSEWEVLRKHEVEAPKFPATMRADDVRILKRCLQKKPEDRYPSVADLLRDLQAPVALGDSLLLRSAPAVAPVPSPAPSAQTPSAVPPSAGPIPQPAAPTSTPPPVLRDPSQSPYGLPWRHTERPRGLLAFLVRVMFLVVDLALFCVLLPVRLVSRVIGGGVGRLFGTLGRLAVYVVLGVLLLGAVFALLMVVG
jgi:serine/threonine protein kinase